MAKTIDLIVNEEKTKVVKLLKNSDKLFEVAMLMFDKVN